MQVITKATLDQFLNALGVNRRHSWHEAQDGQRVYQIDNGVSPTRELVSAVGKEFWEYVCRCKAPTYSHVEAMLEFFSKHCKVRLAHESDATTRTRPVGGYIVLNDELMGLHNMIRGHGEWMLDNAINDGATKLTCFDVPHLIKLYQSRGFVETDRAWNTTRGKPDVVCMVKK